MKTTVFLGTHMVLSTDKQLYAMRFDFDQYGNLSLIFDKRGIPLTGKTAVFGSDHLHIRLTIHRVQIRRTLNITFSLQTNIPSVLTVERTREQSK